MALTPKKKLYAEARMAGVNIKDSAIAAGYSEETARQSGSRLEKDEDVRRYMGRIDAVEPKPKQKAEPKAKESKPAGRQTPDADPIPISESMCQKYTDPLKFLEAVMNNSQEETKHRVKAAESLAAYTISKPGDKGKKGEQKEKAAESAKRFAQMPPPNLRAVN